MAVMPSSLTDPDVIAFATAFRLTDQPEVLVVSDQRGCPTSCVDLAEGMIRLAETDNYGIHHMRGGGECTWFDFAAHVLEVFELRLAR